MSEHFLCLFEPCLFWESLIKVSGINVKADISLPVGFFSTTQRDLNLDNPF